MIKPESQATNTVTYGGLARTVWKPHQKLGDMVLKESPNHPSAPLWLPVFCPFDNLTSSRRHNLYPASRNDWRLPCRIREKCLTSCGWMLSASTPIWSIYRPMCSPKAPKAGPGVFSAHQCQAPCRHQAASTARDPHKQDQSGKSQVGPAPSSTCWAELECVGTISWLWDTHYISWNKHALPFESLAPTLWVTGSRSCQKTAGLFSMPLAGPWHSDAAWCVWVDGKEGARGGFSSKASSELSLLPKDSPCPETGLAPELTAPRSLSESEPQGQDTGLKSRTDFSSNSGPASCSLHDFGQVNCFLWDSVFSPIKWPPNRISLGKHVYTDNSKLQKGPTSQRLCISGGSR